MFNVNMVTNIPIMNILSVNASINAPRVEVILYFLARYPSSQSVIPVSTKMMKPILALPGNLKYTNIATKKSSGIRARVIQLAKFITQAVIQSTKKIVATKKHKFLFFRK